MGAPRRRIVLGWAQAGRSVGLRTTGHGTPPPSFVHPPLPSTHLIEEYVLPVCPMHCSLLQDAVRADAVLGGDLLPELHANCRGWKETPASARDPVARVARPHRMHIDACPTQSSCSTETNYPSSLRSILLWLPHWPTCNVTSSRGIWGAQKEDKNKGDQKLRHEIMTRGHGADGTDTLMKIYKHW